MAVWALDAPAARRRTLTARTLTARTLTARTLHRAAFVIVLVTALLWTLAPTAATRSTVLGPTPAAAAVVAVPGRRASPVPVVPRPYLPGAAPSTELWAWQLPDPKALVDNAVANRVTVLLVWVSPGFTTNHALLAKLASLKALAATHRIALHALSGDPSWVHRPDVAAKWAREAAGSRLFTALHLDIEPQALPTWWADTTNLSHGLLAALDAVGATGLPVEADIPAWFATIALTDGSLADDVLRRVSTITVMAYQNSATRVLAAARTEVQSAYALGKKAYIGVNLAPAGQDAPSTTLLGQSATAIWQQLQSITVTARAWPGFAGVAIHDAEYLTRLVPLADLPLARLLMETSAAGTFSSLPR